MRFTSLAGIGAKLLARWNACVTPSFGGSTLLIGVAVADLSATAAGLLVAAVEAMRQIAAMAGGSEVVAHAAEEPGGGGVVVTFFFA